MLRVYKEHVCNKCHDLLTIAHSLKNIATSLLMGISKNKDLKRLNNSVTYGRRVW